MNERLKIYDEKMTKTMKSLESELQAVRAGRANPHVLDRIMVDYYGSPTAIQQVANVQVPEARMITITPWEPKMVKAINKAILTSDLGINPSDDGRVIRLVFPELTEDRRKQLVKDVKKKGEGAKVAVRNIRRDGNEMLKKLKKSEEVSEDEVSDDEEQLQKMTDRYIKKIDTAIEEKTKELHDPDHCCDLLNPDSSMGSICYDEVSGFEWEPRNFGGGHISHSTVYAELMRVRKLIDRKSGKGEDKGHYALLRSIIDYSVR